MNLNNVEREALSIEARTGSVKESNHAEIAYMEWHRTGKTDLRCLRCGGHFKFETWASAYRVTCENKDYSRTVRGI